MGQSCGVTHSSKGTTAHQHSTNTSSHLHTPHLPRGQMRHQKKNYSGERRRSHNPLHHMEHAGACLYQLGQCGLVQRFIPEQLASLPGQQDNSKLLREKTRCKLETCIPEMMFLSYCTCATPVTVIATPSAVSTSSHLGCNVIISREILPKNVKCLHVSRLHTLSSSLCISCLRLPAALITGNAKQAQNAAKGTTSVTGDRQGIVAKKQIFR